jgi:GTPase SAR1 family protein
LGQIGSGKTTLYNRITGSKDETGGESVTLNVFLGESAFGKVPFKVLATPGFGASVKKIDHVAGIMAAFTEGPVNRIILVVKLERIESMVNALKRIIAPFSRYRELITILVTHWDIQQI